MNKIRIVWEMPNGRSGCGEWQELSPERETAYKVWCEYFNKAFPGSIHAVELG